MFDIVRAKKKTKQICVCRVFAQLFCNFQGRQAHNLSFSDGRIGTKE